MLTLCEGTRKILCLMDVEMVLDPSRIRTLRACYWFFICLFLSLELVLFGVLPRLRLPCLDFRLIFLSSKSILVVQREPKPFKEVKSRDENKCLYLLTYNKH